MGIESEVTSFFANAFIHSDKNQTQLSRLSVCDVTAVPSHLPGSPKLLLLLCTLPVNQ